MVIWMQTKSDWFVMNMVKQHIRNLKNSPQDADTVQAVARNEAALRSFFDDIKSRSDVTKGRSEPLAA